MLKGQRWKCTLFSDLYVVTGSIQCIIFAVASSIAVPAAKNKCYMTSPTQKVGVYKEARFFRKLCFKSINRENVASCIYSFPPSSVVEEIRKWWMTLEEDCFYDNGEFSPSFFMANWITKQRRIFSIIIATCCRNRYADTKEGRIRRELMFLPRPTTLHSAQSGKEGRGLYPFSYSAQNARRDLLQRIFLDSSLENIWRS